MKTLKYQLSKDLSAIDPNLLDQPDAILPGQPGQDTNELRNDRYEKGLRYCLDTHSDPHDWRRKAMEACFECFAPKMYLRAVCLSCARNCVAKYRLRPYIRTRKAGDACDCRLSGFCVSKWSKVRAEFDKICDEDTFIGPNQVRQLLKTLREPYPVETVDVEDCLSTVAEGEEDTDTPRIQPWIFEKWYRKYYNEDEDEND